MGWCWWRWLRRQRLSGQAVQASRCPRRAPLLLPRKGCSSAAASLALPPPPPPPSLSALGGRGCWGGLGATPPRHAPPHFRLSAAGAGLFPFTPASLAAARLCHHLAGEDPLEMPSAPRPDCQSDDELEPETPMEPESALEGSHDRKSKVGRQAASRWRRWGGHVT